VNALVTYLHHEMIRDSGQQRPSQSAEFDKALFRQQNREILRQQLDEAEVVSARPPDCTVSDCCVPKKTDRSEYERLREENIRRNEDYLRELGLGPSTVATQLAPPPDDAKPSESDGLDSSEDDADNDDGESDGESDGSADDINCVDSSTPQHCTETPMQSVERLMQRLFGHVRWRPGQEWAVEQVILKRRALFCAPTGP
jgi:hypothetical protein